MLKTTNWESLIDINENGNYTDDLADAAIGSPTLEMFMESWNEKYHGITGYTQDLTCEWGSYYNDMADETGEGYLIGSGEADYINLNVEGYNGTTNDENLYFPHTSEIDECYAYWLASPSAYLNDNMLFVSCNGSIRYDFSSYYCMGVRPVVSLKSEIKGEWKDGVWELKQ